MGAVSGKGLFDFLHFSYLKKLYYPILFILLVLLIGTIGYMIIEGYSLLDAFYMTVITIGTVGFQEVHPLSGGGRLFTSFLIITSFGTFAFALTALSRYVMDGEINRYFKGHRMTTSIQKLENHVVVCGYGRNGKQAVKELRANGQPFVVIEKNPELLARLREKQHLFIEGDATQDNVLMQSNLEKARALITTLPEDADNVFIVLTARSVNSKMIIISRASDDNSDKKLKVAGANNVIMPDKIGGAHMASLVMKPDVIEFIDYITGQGGMSINLGEITFETLPGDLKNKTIRDLEIRNRSGANIIGFKTAEGEFVINPSPDTVIIPHAKLFVLGTPEQMEKLKQIVSA
jgi:voltage-gated potassium channel